MHYFLSDVGFSNIVAWSTTQVGVNEGCHLVGDNLFFIWIYTFTLVGDASRQLSPLSARKSVFVVYEMSTG